MPSRRGSGAMAGGEPRRSDVGVRTASAVIMLAVSGAALWLGGWTWTLFVAFLAVVLLWEWRALVRGFARTALSQFAWNAGGFVYIAVAAGTLLFLRNQPDGTQLVITLIGSVIATDVGAYFAGRTIGGPKIAPRISPSKTWAGLFGGVLAAGCVFYLLFPPLCFDTCPRGVVAWWNQLGTLYRDFDSDELALIVIVGALIAIVAQAGDFFESWMKRRAGVKDSSNLIPGHGGVLDRLDGLLAVLFLIALWGALVIGAALAGGGSLLPTPA